MTEDATKPPTCDLFRRNSGADRMPLETLVHPAPKLCESGTPTCVHTTTRLAKMRQRGGMAGGRGGGLLVVVDDAQRLEEVRRLSHRLAHQHEGDLVEAEEHDVAILLVVVIRVGRGAAHPELGARGALAPLRHELRALLVEVEVVLDERGRDDGHEGEGHDHDLQRLRVDVAMSHPEAGNHEGELADLGGGGDGEERRTRRR